MIDVKALRKSLGLTQIEFAELLGITQSALSLNEKRFSLPEHHLKTIENKFGEKILNEYMQQDYGTHNTNVSYGGKGTKQSNVVSGDNPGLRVENELLRKENEYLKEQLEFFKDLVKGKSQ